jgi:ArsR family transcriptional regulator
MLELAEQRLARFDNVDLRRGELEALPLDDASMDAATFMLVLHHIERPALAIAEASRCLRPGGRLLIVDMMPHDREEYRHEMGHVWLGFSEDRVTEYLDDAGFGSARFGVLPPALEAKGPNLFAMTADKKE